jgi:hypothetical protein
MVLNPHTPSEVNLKLQANFPLLITQDRAFFIISDLTFAAEAL